MANRVTVERNVALLLPVAVVGLAAKLLGLDIGSLSSILMVCASAFVLTIFLGAFLEPRRPRFAEADRLGTYFHYVCMASLVIPVAVVAVGSSFL